MKPLAFDFPGVTIRRGRWAETVLAAHRAGLTQVVRYDQLCRASTTGRR